MTGYEQLIVRQDWNRATDRDWAEALKRIPLFSRLDRRQLRKLAGLSQFAEFAPGDIVLLEGAPADSFYVILSGEATVLQKPGRATLRLGDHFGEMGLLDDRPRSATVVATSELHVMRIPPRAFSKLLEENSEIALTLLTTLGRRVRELEKQTA